MKKTIRNLFLVSCFLFTVSYDSCTSGVDYDKRHKIYVEEVENYYCPTNDVVYGRRWERFGTVTFLLGTILSFSAFIAWRRNQPTEVKSILDLGEK